MRLLRLAQPNTQTSPADARDIRSAHAETRLDTIEYGLNRLLRDIAAIFLWRRASTEDQET